MADRVVSYVFRGDISGLKASLTAAGQSVGKLADDLTKADRESAKFRQGLSTVGDSAGKMGLAAAAGLGLVVKAAMDWESAWAGVTKTVDGSAAQMAQLEGELRGLAKTLPASHQEIAAVAEAAGQLGVQREAITSFTRTMIDLGETTNLTADDAATAIAQMANVMRTAPDEIDNLGASLVAVGNAGASTERQIIEMAQGISGAAAVVGLAEADVLGIANAVASIGIEVEAGGSSISRVLTSMGKSVAEGGDLLNEFATTAGMTAEQFATAFEQRPAEAFTAFIEGLGRIQESGGNVFGVLDRLGMEDVRVSRALLGMAADSDKFAGSLDLANQAWEENTALAIEAAKRYETTGSKAQVALNNITDAAIEFGDVALPAVAAAAEGVADFASAVGSLPGPVKTAGTSLLGITAVLGGGAWFTAKTISGVADMRQALSDIGATAPRAAKGLEAVGRGATAVAVAFAGFAIADSIAKIGDDAVPGLEATTRALIDLANAGNVAAISAQFNDLGDSIERLADKNWAQELNDSLSGALGGLGAGRSFREAEADIKAIDAALANLVTSGNADVAADALENLGLSSEQMADLEPLLVQYGEALAGIENDALLAADGGEAAAGAFGEVGDAAGAASGDIDEMVDSMREARSEALRAANAEIDYQASLDDARQALKDNGRTLDITTEKGRANRSALNDVAGAWNNLSAEAKDAPGAYAAARKAFIDLAVSMGASRAEARQLAQQLMEIPPRRAVEVTVDTSAARAALESFIATSSGRVISIGTRVVNSSSNRIARASGGPVYGPGTSTSDSIPAWLSNGEFVMNAKAVQRYGLDTMHAMNAMRLAAGGPVGMARGGSIDDRLDVLRLQQQINELRRDLAEDGKDQLKGLARAIAEAELEAAKRDLRQARRAPFAERRADLRDQRAALRSIEFDVEGGASVEETRDALREFRADVREAGGTWTKEMARTAHRLIDLAKATERTERRIEDETKLRDILKERLDKEIAALEDVRSAMQSFSAQVGGNFRSDVFGLGGVVAGGSASAPVNDPALNAARAALAGAEGRYQAALTSGGDPLQRSYLASKALAEVAQYRDQVDELERSTAATVDAQEQTVSGLDALREALIRDTEQARAFHESLSAVSGVLDRGLFEALAASGDVGTAAQIAGLDRGSLEELNLLWQEREAAAAQVATFATQQVFGQQLDAATRVVQLTERAIARQDRTISTLNNRLEVLDSKVEAGAKRGVQALGPQIERIERAIQGQARQIASIQQGGKRGRN